MDASEAARRLAAKRPVRVHSCTWCGRAFDALEAARYCSQSCRSAAWKHRHKETAAERVLREVRDLLRRLPEEQRNLALQAIRADDFLSATTTGYGVPRKNARTQLDTLHGQEAQHEFQD